MEVWGEKLFYLFCTEYAILYVMHGTFAHFREEPQILGYHLETELNVFS